MKLTAIVAVGSFAMPAALATPLNVLFGREVGDKCEGFRTDGNLGECMPMDECEGVSFEEPYCPNDPGNIQVRTFVLIRSVVAFEEANLVY